jgi:hypothetical protein
LIIDLLIPLAFDTGLLVAAVFALGLLGLLLGLLAGLWLLTRLRAACPGWWAAARAWWVALVLTRLRPR